MTELERCNHEISQMETLLREGHTDIDGLLLALVDWCEERRLLIRSGEEFQNGATRNHSEN